MTPGSNGSGGAIASPPAGGVRNLRGNQAQNRGPMTKEALRKKQTPTGGVKPGAAGGQGQFGGGKPTPLDKQREREKRKREREARARANQNQNQNKPTSPQPPVKPYTPTAAPNPYGANKPDPRDENYWANVNAINAMYDVELAGLDAEGQQAETRFNEEGMVQAEYNRQRKRNMGESRLGSGSAYSGSARRDQLENDLDYMIAEGRRFRDKSDVDLQREIERGRINSERDADIRELETATAESLADRMAEESATSAGDAGIPEPTPPGEKPAKPTPGARNQQRLTNKIANQTERIKKLREQLAKTKDPKKRARIEKQIRILRKRRSHAKGKVR